MHRFAAILAAAAALLASVPAPTAAERPATASAPTFAGPLQYELRAYNPAANAAAVVTADGGKARFTVLTGALIRMQYLSGSAWSNSTADAATLAIVNRDLPVPKFTAQPSGSGVTITTDEVVLTYSGGPFSSASLKVTSANSSSAFTSWDGSMMPANDPGSLLGTFRTLDGTSNVTLNCTENGKQHCVWGILSRSGWGLLDDSDNVILDNFDWPFDDSGAPYPRSPVPGNVTDWYLFAHGHDYTRALLDFSSVSGSMALPPRAALGVWYTRWYDYANVEVRDIVEGYASRGVPLDTLVLDMNWHKKDSWTGYTFDGNLYPVPSDTGDFARNVSGLMTLVNLHDASGVANFEDTFQAYCNAVYGASNNCSSATVVPANFVQRSFMNALEDIVWKADQDVFADYAWIDWQQGENGGRCPGGKANPTIQLNKVRNTDPRRRAGGVSAGTTKRGMQLGRFGGYGNQRYPVGFSGDVAGLLWKNLAYQPYFSMTASNAGGISWSHDIEGPGSSHEMYARWVTWGSLSHVMRSHERGMSAGGCKDPFPDFDDGETRCSQVMPWNTPMFYFEAIRHTLTRRAMLVPYLYTATREGFETGVSLMRPMYYSWPEEPMAYGVDSLGTMTNYMLGPDLLVSPITEPGDATTLVTKRTWLPPGSWIELDTHKLLAGNRTFARDYAISQTPIFARAGAVVPIRPISSRDTIATAKRVYTNLAFVVYPGAASGSGSAYEDDGETTAYIDQQDYHFIDMTYTRDPTTCSFSAEVVSRAGASFSGEPTERFLTLAVVNAPAADVASGVLWSVKGGTTAALPFSRWGGPGSWSYDGQETSLLVELPAVTPAQLKAGITVTTKATAAACAAAKATLSAGGVKGLQANAKLAKSALDRTRQAPGAHTPDPAYPSQLVALGDALAVWAGADQARWAAAVTNATTLGKEALEELDSLLPPPPPPPGALVQLHCDQRKDSLLCGTADCVSSQADNYNQVRIEGYQPSSSDPNAIKFSDWWDQDVSDNWASSATTAPSGYTPATFSNGYIYSKQVTGTVPLYCYYNDAMKDHMAVATQDGISGAQKEGYKLCDEFQGGVMGFVATSPPGSAEHSLVPGPVGGVDQGRANFTVRLLQSALAA